MIYSVPKTTSYLVSLFFTNKAVGGSKDNSLKKPSLDHLKLLEYNGIHCKNKKKIGIHRCRAARYIEMIEI